MTKNSRMVNRPPAPKILAAALVAACAALLPAKPSPAAWTEIRAEFDWRMPDRFGIDQNEDGLIDFFQIGRDSSDPPNGLNDTFDLANLATHPAGLRIDEDSFQVDFDACGSYVADGILRTYLKDLPPGSPVTYTWIINGAPQPGPNDCSGFKPRLPEGTYEVSLEVTWGASRGSFSGISNRITKTVVVQDWLIVAIGDSYGSGEGNPDKPGVYSQFDTSLGQVQQELQEVTTQLGHIVDFLGNDNLAIRTAQVGQCTKFTLCSNTCPVNPDCKCMPTDPDTFACQSFCNTIAVGCRCPADPTLCKDLTAEVQTAEENFLAALEYFYAKKNLLKQADHAALSALALVRTAAEWIIPGHWDDRIREYKRSLDTTINDYNQATQGTWQDKRCDRSAASGQAQAALKIERADPKTSVTFVHLACSGATITRGVLGPYMGSRPDGTSDLTCPQSANCIPPQLDQLKALVGNREVDALVTSIGGNDANFVPLIEACMWEPDCTLSTNLNQVPVEDTVLQAHIRRLCDHCYLGQAAGDVLEFITDRFGGTPPDDLCLFGYDYQSCVDVLRDALAPAKSAATLFQQGIHGSCSGPFGFRCPSSDRSLAEKYASLQTRLASLPVKGVRDNQGRMYLTNYPNPLSYDATSRCYWERFDPIGNRFFDALERMPPKITQNEADWLTDPVARVLTEQIEAAATANGWRLVDIAGATDEHDARFFDTHGYCTDDPWFRRLFFESFIVQGSQTGGVHPTGNTVCYWLTAGSQAYNDCINRNDNGHAVYRNRIAAALTDDFYPGGLGAPPRAPINTLPNFVVSRITVSPPSPLPSTLVDVTVTVRNLGIPSTESITVDFYRNRTSTPMGAGDLALPCSYDRFTRVYTCTGRTWFGAGTSQMYAWVDRNGMVTESREGDNLFGPQPLAVGPDLVVESLAIPGGASWLYAGQTVDVTATILNRGTSKSAAYRVDLYRDRAEAPLPGDLGDIGCNMFGLEPGLRSWCTLPITFDSAGTYRLHAQVDTDRKVAESDEGNNVLGPVPIDAGPQPDLTVQSVVISPALPKAGSYVDVTVTVRNSGGTAHEGFRLDIYPDLAEPPPDGSPGTASCSFTGLAAGATASCTRSVEYRAVGTFQLFAQVDTTEKVWETDEGNNVSGPHTVTVSLPDLVVESVSLDPPAPVAGRAAQVSVTVRNQGGVGAENLWVAFFKHRVLTPEPGWMGTVNCKVTSLEPGATTSCTGTVTYDGSGTFQTYASVDLENHVPELQEGNNVHGPVPVTVRSPDLLLTGVSIDPALPGVGAPVTVRLAVANQGDWATGAFTVGVYKDRGTPPTTGSAPDFSCTFPGGIAAGADAECEGTVTYDWAGAHQLYALADSQQQVVESREDNNVLGPREVLAGVAPNLVVLGISTDPAGPSAMLPAQVTLTVRNRGTAAAGPFRVAFYRDLPAAPSFGDAGDMTCEIPGLAAVTTTTCTGMVVFPSEGTKQMYALADVDEQVTESQEDDNLRGPQAVNVFKLPPDFVVDRIVATPATPQEHQAVSVTVTVSNQGLGPGGSEIHFYDHRASPPATGDLGQNSCVFYNLAPAASTSCTFDAIYPSAATYQMYAQVDPRGLEAEGNEGNNVLGQPITVVSGVPDLKVRRIELVPDSPTEGQAATVRVEVVNEGFAATGPFSVDFYANPANPPAPGDPGDVYCGIAGLDRGKSEVCTGTVTFGSAGTFAAYAQVDGDQQVVESSEANNVSGPLQVRVLRDAPDLVVESVQLEPASPVCMASARAVVTVRNQGGAAAGAFRVKYYPRVAAWPPTAAEESLAIYSDVASLPARNSTSFSATFSHTARPGTYAAYAHVDTAGQVTESDEGNNVLGPHAVVVRPGEPDLAIDWIVVNDPSPTAMRPVPVAVTVHNRGGAQAGPFRVDFYKDLPGAPTALADGSFSCEVALLDIDATTNCAGTVVFPSSGTFRAYAQVDTALQVPERDEANNGFGPQQIVVGEAPDLVVRGIAVSPSTPAAYQQAHVAISVENQGLGAAGPFSVEFFTGLPQPGAQGPFRCGVGSLAPGGRTTCEGDLAFGDRGSLATYALVDNMADVFESNESNNQFGPVFVRVLPPPDLLVDTVEVAPAEPLPSQPVNVTVHVRNQGGPVGAFTVFAYPHLDSPPTTQQGSDFSCQVPGLAAKGTGSCTVELAYPWAGTFALYVQAQPQMMETDVSNNSFGPRGITAGGPPDLAVEAVRVEPVQPGAGQPANVTVTVRNQGERVARDFTVAIFKDRSSPPAPGTPGDASCGIVELDAGNAASCTSQVTYDSEGGYMLWALADAGLRVTEVDENNNAAGPETVVVLPKPDLVVDMIGADPAIPAAGQETVMTVTVRNQGAGPAGPFRVDFYHDRTTPPPPSTEGAFSCAIAGLASGETATCTGRVGYPVGGRITIYAYVDSTESTTETNEGNNVLTKSIRVTRPPDLVPPGDQTVAEGSPLEVLLSGSDPELDPVTYAASSLPPGSSLDSMTGRFLWTPDFDQGGDHPITFHAFDLGPQTQLAIADPAWVGESRAGAADPTPWFPAVDGEGVATLATDDVAEGRISSQAEVARGEMVTFEVKPSLASGGLAPDGAVFYLGDGRLGSGSASAAGVGFTADGRVCLVTSSEPECLLEITSYARDQWLTASLGIDAAGDLVALVGSAHARHPSGFPEGAMRFSAEVRQSDDGFLLRNVSKGFRLSDSEDIVVHVTDVNRPPVANADTRDIREDGPTMIPVLANDTDPDGDALQVAAVALALHGTATPTADGSALVFIPEANYCGQDTITYTVSDGRGGIASAEVAVTISPVNDPPTAADDSETADEDRPKALAVLANDSDVDGGTLCVTAVTQPPLGSVTVESCGVVYSPQGAFEALGAGEQEIETFTYSVSDGQGGEATATVSLTVTGVNDPPVLDPVGARSVVEGQTLTFAVSAADVDSGLITYAATGLPAGAVFNRSTATFTWRPLYSQAGTFRVTFTASDGALTDSEVVTITVANPRSAIFSDTFSHAGTRDPDWKVLSGTFSLGGGSYAARSVTATNLAQVLRFDPLSLPLLSESLQSKVRLNGLDGTRANARIVFALLDKVRYRHVTLRLGKIEIGQVGTLGGQTAGVKRTILKPGIVANTWYALKVNVGPSGYVRVYLGSTLVGSYRFLRDVPGGVGIGADRARSLFDNYVVYDEVMIKAAPKTAP